MKRFARKAVVGVICLLMAGVIATAAWTLGSNKTSYLTDGGGIKERAADAPVRDVLWTEPERLPAPINLSGDDYEPRLTADGKSMFLVRGRAGDNADIYTSTNTDGVWSDPVPLEGINTGADELGPVPTADGRGLYFYSDRAGTLGGYDLWITQRTTEGWSEPVNLGPTINSPVNDYGAAPTPSGNTIYFASNRAGPDEEPHAEPFRRHYDLYRSVMTDKGWSEPALLGPASTEFNEGAPAVSPVGDFLYFSSDRPGGAGGYDLYRARLTDAGIGVIEPLGRPVNTPGNELDPAPSFDGFVLHFSSDRGGAALDGGVPEYDVYVARSREVYRTIITEGASLDWLALLKELWPWLLLLAILLTLMGIALALLRDSAFKKRWATLSLLMQCLILSVLLHAMLAALFTAWHVKTRLEGLLDSDGGTRIALVSRAAGSGASGIAAQVRGAFTEVEVTPSESEPAPTSEIVAPEPSDAVATPSAGASTPLAASRSELSPLEFASATPSAPAVTPTASEPEAAPSASPSATPAVRVATRVTEAASEARPVASTSMPEAASPAAPAATQAIPTDTSSAPVQATGRLAASRAESSAEAPAASTAASASAAMVASTPAIDARSLRGPEAREAQSAAEASVRVTVTAPDSPAAAQVPDFTADASGTPEPTAAPMVTTASRGEASGSASTATDIPTSSVSSLPTLASNVSEASPTAALPATGLEAVDETAILDAPRPSQVAVNPAPVISGVEPSSMAVPDVNAASLSADRGTVSAANAAETVPLATPTRDVSPPSLGGPSAAFAAALPSPATDAIDEAEALNTPRPTQVAVSPAPSISGVEPSGMAAPDIAAASLDARRAAVTATTVAADIPSSTRGSTLDLPTLGGPPTAFAAALPGAPADPADLEVGPTLELLGASERAPDLALFEGDLSAPLAAPPDPDSADLLASRLRGPVPDLAAPVPSLSSPLELPSAPVPSLAFRSAAPLPTQAPAPESLLIAGSVIDAETMLPVAGAIVRYDADGGDQLRFRTGEDGTFELTTLELPDVFALTAVRAGYEPGASEGTLRGVRRGAPIEIFLTPESRFTVALEEEPRVHHLGNDSFSGRVNSQFQRQSEGEVYEAEFFLPADAAPPNVGSARIVMLLKGAQTENPIWINGRRLDDTLTDSPESGRYEEWSADVPSAWLRPGRNTLRIRSVNAPGTDIDDFEFVNVRIEIERGQGEAEL
ncbi:MAG: hypothetical protein AAGB51_09125 [Planctomycetota bacterium]